MRALTLWLACAVLYGAVFAFAADGDLQAEVDQLKHELKVVEAKEKGSGDPVAPTASTDLAGGQKGAGEDTVPADAAATKTATHEEPSTEVHKGEAPTGKPPAAATEKDTPPTTEPKVGEAEATRTATNEEPSTETPADLSAKVEELTRELHEDEKGALKPPAATEKDTPPTKPTDAQPATTTVAPVGTGDALDDSEKESAAGLEAATDNDTAVREQADEEAKVVRKQTAELASEEKEVKELKEALAKAKEEGFCNILQNIADSLADTKTLTEERKVRRTHNYVCGMLSQMNHDMQAKPVVAEKYCQTVSSTLGRFAHRSTVREQRKQRRTHAYLCGVLNDMSSSLHATPHHSPSNDGEDEAWKSNCKSEYLCGLLSGLSSELAGSNISHSGEKHNGERINGHDCPAKKCYHGKAVMRDAECQCDCHDGWKGVQCKEKAGEKDDTCENQCSSEHGTRRRVGDECVCACALGYTGKDCEEEDEDYVAETKKLKKSVKPRGTGGNPNHDSDHDNNNSSGGMEIVHCQMDASDCGENSHGFDEEHCRCKCKDGWEGVRCEEAVGDAKPASAHNEHGFELVRCELNEAKCENGADFDESECKCVCKDGWGGAFCNEKKKDCDLECQNGGTLDSEECICECPEGFVGDNCEDEEESVPSDGFKDCAPAAIFKERFPDKDLPEARAFTDECYDVVLNLCEAMSVKDKTVKNVFNYMGCMVVECANKNGRTRMTVSRLTHASKDQCKDMPQSPECPEDNTDACKMLKKKTPVTEVLWDSMMCRAYENTLKKGHRGKIHKCSHIKEHLEDPEGGDDPEMNDFMTCKDCKKDSITGKHLKHHQETPATLDMEEVRSEGNGEFMVEVEPLAALESNRRARAYRRLRNLTGTSIGLRGNMSK